MKKLFFTAVLAVLLVAVCIVKVHGQETGKTAEPTAVVKDAKVLVVVPDRIHKDSVPMIRSFIFHNLSQGQIIVALSGKVNHFDGMRILIISASLEVVTDKGEIMEISPCEYDKQMPGDTVYVSSGKRINSAVPQQPARQTKSVQRINTI